MVGPDNQQVKSSLKVCNSEVAMVELDNQQVKSSLKVCNSEVAMVELDNQQVKSSLKVCNSEVAMVELDNQQVKSSLKVCNSEVAMVELDNQQVKSSFKELGLREEIVTACANLGWTVPSPIQVEAIPPALDGKDIIGLAHTGSGKTGAFAIPILHALLESPHPLFCCVISPTRELAIQIAQQFEALGSCIGLKVVALYGGGDLLQQEMALARRPHIIVATPGRLGKHLRDTRGFSLRTLKYLVLDEADRLLNEDFEKEIDEILKNIPRERRTFLFSATMTKKVQKLQRACLRNPVKIEVSSKYSTVEGLTQQYVFVPSKHKDCYFVYILKQMTGSSAMVFSRTCEATNLLALMLRNLKFRAIPISGHMSQAKRLGALNKFKAGECSILVCTDVASRGLDLPLVDLVINYDIPSNSKDYIHRVGRTARAGRTGVAISLVNQYELEWYMQIEKLLGMELPKYPAKEEDVLMRLDDVREANKLAHLRMKMPGGAKRRGRGEDEGEEIEKFIGHQDGKRKGGKSGGNDRGGKFGGNDRGGGKSVKKQKGHW